jgi:hypothetical protein
MFELKVMMKFYKNDSAGVAVNSKLNIRRRKNW